MNKLKFFKIVMSPVLIEQDENGDTVAEHGGEPLAVYNKDQMLAVFDAVQDKIAERNAQAASESSD